LDTSGANTIPLGDAGKDQHVTRHVVQVLGTWTGTLIFEGTLGIPGTGTYVTVGYTTPADPSTVVTAGTFTANGIYNVLADGLTDVRIRVSVTGSGTATFLDTPLSG
jgi:hypothetical protein